jgi:hypothetical protein
MPHRNKAKASFHHAENHIFASPHENRNLISVVSPPYFTYFQKNGFLPKSKQEA